MTKNMTIKNISSILMIIGLFTMGFGILNKNVNTSAIALVTILCSTTIELLNTKDRKPKKLETTQKTEENNAKISSASYTNKVSYSYGNNINPRTSSRLIQAAQIRQSGHNSSYGNNINPRTSSRLIQATQIRQSKYTPRNQYKWKSAQTTTTNRKLIKRHLEGIGYTGPYTLDDTEFMINPRTNQLKIIERDK